MIRTILILICAICAIGTTASAQYHRDSPAMRGDSTTARLAQHGPDYAGDTVRVQLGYINGDSATVKEIVDNLEIGLKVLPRNESYKVILYTIGYQLPGRDYMYYPDLSGTTPVREAYKKLDIHYMPKGALLVFSDIRIQKDGSTYSLPIKQSVVIKVK